VIEEVLAPGVSERPNWTLPRLADEIEKRTGKRISKSRLSVVLKRMARPVGKQFSRPDLSSLHQRIRPQGRALAKMEIRASRAS
jgi:hypothetical protein